MLFLVGDKLARPAQLRGVHRHFLQRHSYTQVIDRGAGNGQRYWTDGPRGPVMSDIVMFSRLVQPSDRDVCEVQAHRFLLRFCSEIARIRAAFGGALYRIVVRIIFQIQ
jgi:hypothetical protein